MREGASRSGASYSGLLGRVADAASLMQAPERERAHRVIALCTQLLSRSRGADGRLEPAPGDPDLRRELSGLIEVLGRRGSAAIPGASLARAALSDLHNDPRTGAEAAQACSEKLQLLGL